MNAAVLKSDRQDILVLPSIFTEAGKPWLSVKPRLVGGELYSFVIYPILGYLFGHVYPKNPTFGLPCPTTIFTFGLLLWTDKIVPKYVLVIPSIWSLIGFVAALFLGIKEDYGLLIAGVLGSILILIRDRK
jgi:hypothetical protein